MAAPRRAFLDANVLRGQLTNDVLLTLAFDNQFEPRWSQGVLDEVRRNRPPELPEAAIDRRIAQMNRAFPEAMTSGHEHLMPQMQADEKDKHVLAAAVHSGSTVLVTENVKDFNPPSTGQNAMQVERTSQFLSRLVDANPERVADAMREMISRTDKAPNVMPELIDKMAKQQDLAGFAKRLNAAVPEQERGSHPSLGGGLRQQSATSVALDGVARPQGAVTKPAANQEKAPQKPGPERGPGREL